MCASLHPRVSCRTGLPSGPELVVKRAPSNDGGTLMHPVLACRQTPASYRGAQLVSGPQARHRAVHRPQQPAHPAAAAAQARLPTYSCTSLMWEECFVRPLRLLRPGCMLAMQRAPGHMADSWRCVLQWCGGCPLADVRLLHQVVPPAGRFDLRAAPPHHAAPTRLPPALHVWPCLRQCKPTMCRDCQQGPEHCADGCGRCVPCAGTLKPKTNKEGEVLATSGDYGQVGPRMMVIFEDTAGVIR